MEVIDVVKKLVGKIEPVGETNEDNIRYGNLEEMCTLVDKLLYEISNVSQYKDRYEYSMKKAGLYASKFLQEVKEA